MSFEEMDNEEIAEYEEQLQDLSEKEIQIFQLVELQRIRYTLEVMAGPTESESESSSMYECVRCGETIPEDDLEEHSKNQHNWMAEISSIEDEYEPL